MTAQRLVGPLLLIAWAACACSDDDAEGPSAGRGDASGEDGGAGICTAQGDCERSVAVGAAIHISGEIEYDDPPPAGGAHNPCWTDFGVHDEPARPENWVHNLEHGAVVYLYDCPEGCDDERSELTELVEARPFALLTAYPDLGKRFAAVAWGVRLLADELDLDAFAAFYAAHADRALESSSSNPPSSCP